MCRACCACFLHMMCALFVWDWLHTTQAFMWVWLLTGPFLGLAGCCLYLGLAAHDVMHMGLFLFLWAGRSLFCFCCWVWQEFKHWGCKFHLERSACLWHIEGMVQVRVGQTRRKWCFMIFGTSPLLVLGRKGDNSNYRRVREKIGQPLSSVTANNIWIS